MEHLHIEDKLDEMAHKPDSKKSKFELQMEAALKKKEAEEEEKKHHEVDEKEAKKAARRPRKLARKPRLLSRLPNRRRLPRRETDEEKEDGEIFYGAPDEKVWSDKSQAHHWRRSRGRKGPDLSVSSLWPTGQHVAARFTSFSHTAHYIS